MTRTETDGPDAFFQRGKGGQKSTTLSFEHPVLGKVRYAWNSYNGGPAGFDVIAGTPWLVVDVGSRCAEFGYPPEGFVVLAYRQGRWVRVAASSAPQVLKANLLDSQEVFLLRSQHSAEPLNESLARWNGKRTDASLADLAKTLQRGPSSCLETGSLSAAVNNAPLAAFNARPRMEVTAAATGTAAKLDQIAGPEARTLVGEWRSIVYASGCATAFRRIQTGAAPGGPFARIALGTDPTDRRSIVVPYWPTFDPDIRLDRIVCSNGTIAVVQRAKDGTLDATSFDADGNPSDAWRIRIPAESFARLSPKAKVLNFDVSASKLSFSIATYSCTWSQRVHENACDVGERQLFEAPTH